MFRKLKNYQRLYDAGYIIFRFKNICLTSLYSKGKIKPYIEDFINLISEFLINIFTILIFPIRLLKLLYDFIPKIQRISKQQEDENSRYIDCKYIEY